VSPDTLQSLFDAQAETALRWRSSPAGERRERLKRLKSAVLDHRADFYRAGEADFRKPPAEVDVGELMPVLGELTHAISHVGRWMRPRRVLPNLALFGTSGKIRYEPRGRCLILAPWNYPANLALGPLAAALAAGNPAIVKPSELAPHFSALIARIVAQVFPPEEVAVVEGEVDVSTALLKLPFDHIFFTGSPAVGKLVMAAAAKHLTSVTLELGGKSPTIVDASANLGRAARAIVWGKFANFGQTCIAPDHVYVHASVFDRFSDELRKVLASTYGSDAPAQRNHPDLARMVNVRHTQRVAGLVDGALAGGARIVAGGDVDIDARWVQPTLLTDIPSGAAILDSEIFGPVLPLIRYDDVQQAIDDINARPKPLALYIFAGDDQVVDRVIANTSTGGACINTVVMQYGHRNLPFGGVNHSGIGNAHGWFGFRAFSHERAIVRDRFAMGWLLYPPYTRWTRRVLEVLLRL